MLLPLLLSSWLLASILDINMDLNKYLLNEPFEDSWNAQNHGLS